MPTLKEKLRTIIFGTETPAGKAFDIILILAICLSVLAVILESMPGVVEGHERLFRTLEWIITGLFTVEYIVRIYISFNPKRYIFGFWGMIDLISILPAYLSLLLAGYHYFTIVRVLRLLRIFRILKMIKFIREIQIMLVALRRSARKILVFFAFLLLLVIILGSAMYVAEGHANGFHSIPQAVYWAIVTITTVGYGDVVPQTYGGKMIASLIMLLGYSIIAVPTGVVTVEFSKALERTKECSQCLHPNSEKARYCTNCGVSFSQDPYSPDSN